MSIAAATSDALGAGGVALLLAHLWLGAVLAAASPALPNILFVVVDDLGSNDLGLSQELHGLRKATQTPAIDQLAKDGIVLDLYYVDTVCSPTRATFMWVAKVFPPHSS
jgi:hypothetical protein